MQPFQCDLQPQIQESDRTTHTGTTTCCKTQKRNHNDPSRTRLIAGRSHFTRKNTRFRAPASSPKQSPCNIHAAITMRFAASRPKPARIYAHSDRAWQLSCSHSNSICNHRLKKRKKTMHTGTTTCCKTQRRNHNDPSRTRRTEMHKGGTFHCRPQPLYTEKQGFVLRLPPQNKAHATFMQPLQSVSQHPVANLHVSTHIATEHDSNHAAIPMRSETTHWRNA